MSICHWTAKYTFTRGVTFLVLRDTLVAAVQPAYPAFQESERRALYMGELRKIRHLPEQ